MLLIFKLFFHLLFFSKDPSTHFEASYLFLRYCFSAAKYLCSIFISSFSVTPNVSIVIYALSMFTVLYRLYVIISQSSLKILQMLSIKLLSERLQHLFVATWRDFCVIFELIDLMGFSTSFPLCFLYSCCAEGES